MNILVVDDSAVMRTMIIRAIKICDVRLGKIFQAANGKEGLERLEQNLVDLVCVGLNMPVMGGEEMIDRMRGNVLTQDVPVIVVSTEGSRSRTEMLKDKISGFVRKPFKPEAFSCILNEIIGGGDVTTTGTRTPQGRGKYF